MKYKYLVQSPTADGVESICALYIANLILLKCPHELNISVAGVPELQIVGCEATNNGMVLAMGLVNIVYWLSFRMYSDKSTNILVQSLCGDTKDHKREVLRALKRVISWADTWSDRLTPPTIQLESPTCGHILFDKKLRHRRILYMLDCDANSKITPSRLTFADIHLVLNISKWMDVFEDNKEFIIETIPAVVHYVKVIRAELKNGEIAHIGGCGLFDTYFGDKGSWVDCAEVSAGSEHVFKFTQTDKKVKGTLPRAPVVSKCEVSRAVRHTDVEPQVSIEDIEKKAKELIAQTSWREPYNELSFSHNESIGGFLADTASSTEGEKSLFPSIDFDHREDMWAKMKLPAGREVRKTQQIISLLREITAVLPVGGVAVEFCAGGGYVGIPLAALRPDCTVLLTDMNTVSIMYAKQRVEALGLRNVRFLRQELAGIEEIQNSAGRANELTPNPSISPTTLQAASQPIAEYHTLTERELLAVFHVGVALHACGTATDAVLRICTRAGASFVVSPCCYGFLQHPASVATAVSVPSAASLSVPVSGELGLKAEMSSEEVSELSENLCAVCLSPSLQSTRAQPTPFSLEESADRCNCNNCAATECSSPYSSYPASGAFRACGWQGRWFASLCSQADRTFWSHDARAGTHNEKGRFAMRVVDADRLLAAQELGYQVHGAYMQPAEASVKNHILIGRKCS